MRNYRKRERSQAEGILTNDFDYWRALLTRAGFEGEADCFSFMLNEYDKIVILKHYDNWWSAYYCYWQMDKEGELTPKEYKIHDNGRLGDVVRDSLLWLEEYDHIALRRAWRKRGKPIATSLSIKEWEELRGRRESHEKSSL